MAWRIEQLVVAGEFDNTQKDWTIGWLELAGFKERLQLKLAGNCHIDLAGWKFRVKRIEPEIEDCDSKTLISFNDIRPIQAGFVGDMTADQVLKHFEIPLSELMQRFERGENPAFTWRKCLYLEWHDNFNGRVVIQSTRLEVERLGERAFELTEEELVEQQKNNAEEMRHFLTRACDALENQQDEP